MGRSIGSIMMADELADRREDVNRENRLAIRLLAIAGLPLGIVNIIVQVILAPGPEALQFFLRTSWVALYFLLLLILDRWVIPKDYGRSTALIYIVEAPVLICSILLGSFWDVDHQAITFFIFLMAMPMFILDRPIRVTLVTLAWVALFLVACYAVKAPDIFERDLLHALEFVMAAILVSNVVIRIRLLALERLAQSQHNLEHDELTDLRNRRSLGRHVDEFVGRPVTVVYAELDQLGMYNDVYGHDVGDKLFVTFASVLVDAYGHDRAFRYGGNAIACIAEGSSASECLAIIDALRKELRNCEVEGRNYAMTCSVGYTMGQARDGEQFRQMVQLAEIHAHKAQSNGMSNVAGGPFNAEELRAGIIESNIGIHVRPYETNQLTGLPSMSVFVMRANEGLSSIIDDARDSMVGIVSVPRIKRYNSEFGYAQGDELIRFAARKLREAFPNRLICYVSGSQFGILCYKEEIDAGLRKVEDALSSFKDGYAVHCKAGFAKRAKGEDVISLIDQARIAERSIREQEGALYRFYDEQLDADVKFREYIVTHLDEAIEQGYLEVYYQSIIQSSTCELCEEEALSRWNDPVRGMLPPYLFIPPLEENRQLYKLSLHVVRRVLADFDRKREAGIEPVPVSVNLSRYDFEQCDMASEICSLVDASGYARDMLRLEITESAFAENQELLKREVARLRDCGFQVWMDDFGSGYSTLNLLQDLDVDLIKLDMQFLRGASNAGKNLIIVSSILDMAKRMGVATLVEGVETEEQMEAMRAMESDKVQGFLFSKPLPLQEIIEGAAEGRFSFIPKGTR